jgi:hypothetical protein
MINQPEGETFPDGVLTAQRLHLFAENLPEKKCVANVSLLLADPKQI